MRRDREHALLKSAVDAVGSQVPAGLNIDGDSDGRVDNVCFVIDGGPGAWASLLWPHMWSLYSVTANINGKRVYTYNFQLQNTMKSAGVGVLCHEMFHSLGSPDLYHYSMDGRHPVYTWGLMEYDSNPPRHMLSYMKYKYGTWIASIPEITTPGTYSLNPLSSATNNCYKIKSPFSTTEYFVLEYRKKTTTFENSLPGEGLLVIRINTGYTGNASGPPDEVYIYRPNGTTTVDGSPGSANYNSAVGRTAINDTTTNPTSFLTAGGPGGLSISGVGAVGSTISFTVDFSLGVEVISTPSAPSGQSYGYVSVSYPYSSGAAASNFGHPVQYLFDWGDGTNSGWLPEGTLSASHGWPNSGIYPVKAKARCVSHPSVESAWSSTNTVNIAVSSQAGISQNHVLGDFDNDGSHEVAFDFGTLGIWIWDAGSWIETRPENPEGMIALDIDGDGSDEIAVDLGTYGLWLWDSGTWAQLDSNDSEYMIAVDTNNNQKEELILDLGPQGLKVETRRRFHVWADFV